MLRSFLFIPALASGLLAQPAFHKDVEPIMQPSATGGVDRPNVVGDPTSGFQQNVYQWFNTKAFASQPLYTFGKLGRNV